MRTVTILFKECLMNIPGEGGVLEENLDNMIMKLEPSSNTEDALLLLPAFLFPHIFPFKKKVLAAVVIVLLLPNFLL